MITYLSEPPGVPRVPTNQSHPHLGVNEANAEPQRETQTNTDHKSVSNE